MRITSLAPLTLLLTVATGCAPLTTPINIDRNSVAPQETKSVLRKSYILDETKTAYVGQKIVKVNEYIETLAPMFSADKDYYLAFTDEGFERHKKQYGALVDDKIRSQRIVLKKDLEFKGTTILNENKYSLACAKYEPRCLALNSDGTFSGIFLDISNNMSMIHDTHTIQPSDTTFTPTKKSIKTEDGNTQYDIIYTGKDNSKISFKYQEYKTSLRENPVHTQDLTYPPDSKFIRFKNLKIQILSASAEEIIYRVTED